MVTALGPGKFYGSSLPRPRFYTDARFNVDRIDPPPPVNDALMSWANEAYWSMGGLSFTRHRLQGRIEGNVERLRAQIENTEASKIQKETVAPNRKEKKGGKIRKKVSERKEVSHTPLPPPAPVALKRRRVLVSVDDDDEEEEEERVSVKRGLVRKLRDDFERVARESGMVAREDDDSVARRTRSRREEVDQVKGRIVMRKLVKAAGSVAGTRSSPRLAE